MDNEPFSNPLAPPGAPKEEGSQQGQPLTNADFRKLMMTPRVVSSHSGQTNTPVPGSVRSKHHKPYTPKSETTDNQQKKKKFYESIKKHEDDLMNELNKKYRDRAKERREGSNTDHVIPGDLMNNTAYHAVGPSNFDMDAEERRRQMIQESKYLGGDMEHTHLVKGLDYALLQKVKTEIQTKDEEERYIRMKLEEEAKKEEEEKKKSQAGLGKLKDITFDNNDRYAVKGKVAESILKVVFNTKLPERNELFMQGRMAYQYDLVSEFPESDIPTTIIRSKAECPNLDAYNSISTNEIVINKLIQIWLYLRQTGGPKAKKPKLEVKPEDTFNSPPIPKGDSIYDDVGDYVPSVRPRSESRSSRRESKDKRHSYFDKPAPSVSEYSDRRTSEQRALELAASVVGGFAATSDTNGAIKARKRKARDVEPDSYAECYPGAPENDDAIVDSDDDTDYSKMDTGSKKGTVNRWDFDSVEEYGDYMSNREAMPKAAFQYGVKMGDGRKSKTNARKEENAKLNRDLQKINAIIAKRKQNGAEGSMFKSPG